MPMSISSLVSSATVPLAATDMGILAPIRVRLPSMVMSMSTARLMARLSCPSEADTSAFRVMSMSALFRAPSCPTV